ncbi:uncharacterized protein LOC124448762 isoform X2 [Xenia sp. Carnegie-2017]|uniref:uncharacterized protein LOC124448762 isoform X2 n=1 Tax=Xenia sp. Carnegie-2017 TaxID=2897299 RepID=UPI001F03505A|nr:uncharacterized protein LOC124448762 isoform X2 [Xenia sp. Carnegie-2017]
MNGVWHGLWTCHNGDVVDNPFEAQYLFADNEDASDVEKIFTSKEFLTGKLTIFHWSLLDHFGSPKHFSCKDLKNLVIFPWKELEDLGMAANQPEQTNEFSDCDMDDGDFSEANENQQKEHGKDVEVLVKNDCVSSERHVKRVDGSCAWKRLDDGLRKLEHDRHTGYERKSKKSCKGKNDGDGVGVANGNDKRFNEESHALIGESGKCKEKNNGDSVDDKNQNEKCSDEESHALIGESGKCKEKNNGDSVDHTNKNEKCSDEESHALIGESGKCEEKNNGDSVDHKNKNEKCSDEESHALIGQSGKCKEKNKVDTFEDTNDSKKSSDESTDANSVQKKKHGSNQELRRYELHRHRKRKSLQFKVLRRRDCAISSSEEDKEPRKERKSKAKKKQPLLQSNHRNGCHNSTDVYPSTTDVTSPNQSSPTKGKKNNNRTCNIFCNSLNFDITHLDDVIVPRVELVDFIPCMDGCYVTKKPLKRQ